MRLVLDTNTVVSGLIAAGLQGRVELFTSQALLLELEDVPQREKFTGRVAASGLSVTQLVARYGLLAKPVVPAVIDRTAADPDDDHVLACALAAGGIALINAGEAFARLASDRRSGE